MRFIIILGLAILIAVIITRIRNERRELEEKDKDAKKDTKD